MMDPALALQKAIRDRLISASAMTALVPAEAILDRHARPEVFPSIIVGEGQALYARLHDSYFDRVFADLHVWLAEEGTTGAKQVAGVIRDALRDGPLTAQDHRVSDLTVTAARFLRDPDGEHSHGIVSIQAIMLERAA